MPRKTTPTGVAYDDYPLRSPTVETEYNHSDEEQRARLEWEYMLDTGLIPNRNPPASPEIVAQRAANDRLFRSFPHNRRRLW